MAETLRWSGWIACALIGVWAVTSSSEIGKYALGVAIPYATIFLAYRTPRSWSRLTSRGDFSYGVYLWTWPVQQTIVLLWPSLTGVALVGLSLVVTLPLAMMSWVLVERPALALKARIVTRRPAAAVVPSGTVAQEG